MTPRYGAKKKRPKDPAAHHGGETAACGGFQEAPRANGGQEVEEGCYRGKTPENKPCIDVQLPEEERPGQLRGPEAGQVALLQVVVHRCTAYFQVSCRGSSPLPLPVLH